jgi:hypothetical protein
VEVPARAIGFEAEKPAVKREAVLRALWRRNSLKAVINSMDVKHLLKFAVRSWIFLFFCGRHASQDNLRAFEWKCSGLIGSLFFCGAAV